MAHFTSPIGMAGFSILHQARGFKGSEENKTFSQELILNKEEGQKFVDQLQQEANRLHVKEIERARSRGKNVRYPQPLINYRELEDGSIKLTFKRKESDGRPTVIDKGGKPFEKYINKEHKLQIAGELRPYVIGPNFGVSLRLLAVRVIEEESSPESAASLFGIETPKETPSNISDLF